MAPEGGLKVHKERVLSIRPRREFDLLGLSARADVPGVGTVCLVRETDLHPVERRVECEVL